MVKFQSIDEMEKIASEEEDQTSVTKIRGHWLQVIAIGPNVERKQYEYKWGMNSVTRDVAEKVLASSL